MKQQCNIAFIYGSWFILLGGLAFYLTLGRLHRAVPVALRPVLPVCFTLHGLRVCR